MPGQGLLVQRLGGGEQQRLDDAQLLAPVGRLQRDHIGGERQRKARSASSRSVSSSGIASTLLNCFAVIPGPRCCCFSVDHDHAARSRRRTKSGANDFAWRISSVPSRVISRLAVKLEASAVVRSSGSTRNSASS